MVELTTSQVWDAVRSESFAVVGMVSARGQARTAGIVYATDGERLYFTTSPEAWKTKHIAANPDVSVTVTIPKRVWFLPWMKIPAATVTFNGTARVRSATEVPGEIVKPLTAGLDLGDHADEVAVVEIEPAGDFVTYGVGVSTVQMRDVTRASGRAPVSAAGGAGTG